MLSMHRVIRRPKTLGLLIALCYGSERRFDSAILTQILWMKKKGNGRVGEAELDLCMAPGAKPATTLTPKREISVS